MISHDIICPRCQQFLNRPAQVDLIVTHKDKILMTKRDPKFLLDERNEHIYSKYLVSKLGPQVYTSGWYKLPGASIRKEHTIEDAINSTCHNILGTSCVIKDFVGVFSDPKRDPKWGISFCFNVELNSRPQGDSTFMSKFEWVDKNNLPSDIAYDHRSMIEQSLAKKVTSTIKRVQTPREHIRPLSLIPNILLCPHCCQFNNRPVQTDGVLIHQGKLIMIRRQREYLNNEYVEKYSRTFTQDTFSTGYMTGWYVLPGGYVRRNDTVEQTIVREFFEETGLRTKIKRLIGVYSGIDRDAKSNGISICFEMEYVSGKIKAGLETQEVRSVQIDNLPSPIAFDHKEMIEDFLKASKKK